MKKSQLLLQLLVVMQLLNAIEIIRAGDTMRADVPPKLAKDKSFIPILGSTSSAEMRLEKAIVKEIYENSSTLILSLKLKFVNTGQEDVILDRHSSVVSKIMISQSIKMAQQKRYEETTHVYNDLTGITRKSKTLNKADFVFLRPGESYELSLDNFRLFVSSDKDEFGKLKAGTHYLQVNVWTWYYPYISISAARDEWKSRGFLWTDSIISEPMLFIIKKPSCRRIATDKREGKSKK